MITAFILIFIAQGEDGGQTFRLPTYFGPIVLLLLASGVIGWSIATMLGFARARTHGGAIRWFAFLSLCLLIFHVQFLVMAFGIVLSNNGLVLGVGAFFNFFVVLAAICAIIGFIRLPRSATDLIAPALDKKF